MGCVSGSLNKGAKSTIHKPEMYIYRKYKHAPPLFFKPFTQKASLMLFLSADGFDAEFRLHVSCVTLHLYERHPSHAKHFAAHSPQLETFSAPFWPHKVPHPSTSPGTKVNPAAQAKLPIVRKVLVLLMVFVCTVFAIHIAGMYAR